MFATFAQYNANIKRKKKLSYQCMHNRMRRRRRRRAILTTILRGRVMQTHHKGKLLIAFLHIYVKKKKLNK